MSTTHHHRRVLLRGLIFGHRARKDRMVPVFRRQRDFDLRQCEQNKISRPHGQVPTGNSSVWLHSLFLSRMIFLPFSILARAPPPPISPTTLNGGCLLIPKLALNSVANMFSRSRWIVSEVRSSYGDFCIRSLGRKIKQHIRRFSSAV